MNVTETTTTLSSLPDSPSNPDGILGKDDFLKLLLTELQYQDPTDPMDTEKILTQTSQLATLEASDNTNKTLEQLAGVLTQSSSLSVVSSIGKIASLKEKGFALQEDAESTFALYLPEAIAHGVVEIVNNQGEVVRSFDVESLEEGISRFTWNGTGDDGTLQSPGIYQARLFYTAQDGKTGTSVTGEYPIEAVRFEKEGTLLKVADRYLSMNDIEEISGGR